MKGIEECKGCYWYRNGKCVFGIIVPGCAHRYVRMVKNVSLGLKLKVLLFGKARVFERNGLQYYLAKCKKHGYYITYPQGYQRELRCPICLLIGLKGENNI